MQIADYTFQGEEEVKGSGANWFLGKSKHRKMELVSFNNPPIEGGVLPMSDIMVTDKAIFHLLRHQLAWN